MNLTKFLSNLKNPKTEISEKECDMLLKMMVSQHNVNYLTDHQRDKDGQQPCYPVNSI
jgi:hypothetical protein